MNWQREDDDDDDGGGNDDDDDDDGGGGNDDDDDDEDEVNCQTNVVKIIHERQERRQKEYTQSILETTEYPCNITLTVVGHKGVGKTCLVKQLKHEHIPKGGPESTNTADFYINYIAYNPHTGFRKTLDENGEIETHLHRLKQVVDQFRSNKDDRRRRNMETVVHQKKKIIKTRFDRDQNTGFPPMDFHPQRQNENKQTLPENSFYTETTHIAETQTKPKPLHQIEKQTKPEPPHPTEKQTKPQLTHRPVYQTEPEQHHQTETMNRANIQPLYKSDRKEETAQMSSPPHSPQPSTRKRHATASLAQDISSEQRQVIDQIMETKTKEGEEEVKGFVTIYDFGGERVFYNTHHCFMSSNMVFMLVFDVDMCLDGKKSTAGYEIAEHWLKAIATYASDNETRGEGIPPIILIGSHLDKVSSNKTTQKMKFEKVLDTIQANQQLRSIIENHVKGSFAIANLNDSSANKDVYKALWQRIIEIAPLQSQWNKAVPARWIAMEHELIRLKNKGHILLKYEELLDVNSKTAVPLVKEEIGDFLRHFKFYKHLFRYLKCAGRFLCFNIQTKHPFIVLQPQWVIDGFKQIITDDKFKAALSEKMKFDWESYKRTGVLPMDFLKQLWKEERFHTNEEELRIAMETLSLLAQPIPINQADEKNYYIVPSILPNADPERIGKILKDPTRIVTVTLCLKFKRSFIPQAVWDKMIASCVHRFQRLDERGHDGLNFIQRGFACLKVNSRWNMILNCKDNSMKITLFTKSGFAPNIVRKNTLTKDAGESTSTGAGVQLLSILEFLLQRILELNHQSHLEYQYYLHNDYRFAADDQMVMVDELRRTPRMQSLDSKRYPWIKKEDIGVWFVQPGMESPDATGKQNDHRTSLQSSDAEIIAEKVSVTMYFNLFVELGFSPEKIEDFDDLYFHHKSRDKVVAMLRSFITETKPTPTRDTVLQAMQECQMNTEEVIEALLQQQSVSPTSSRPQSKVCLII
ncbi:LOW QUALITY PROTEIN: uncharacterized protein [Argopecten irradians]|uniref:LOW QUALITY PROTEIN: uncharacterized protein n=1 Tax=Argopecten irradians TaxID=31199 RepID=UPI0037154A39